MLQNLQNCFSASHLFHHALFSLKDSIKNSLYDETSGCGVFLDLQKVLDALNHQILFIKPQHYGIRGTHLMV